MSQLKFLVRYEGLDGNEDMDRIFTLEQLIDQHHLEHAIDYSGTLEKVAYKVEEIVPIDWTGWISVEDDLPGTYERCLCYDGEEMFAGYLSLHNEWWELFGEKRNVTHWQYLPKPPETGKR